MTPIDVEAVLDRMAPALDAFLTAHGRTDPLLIGVRTGGVWVA
ncbi:MAG: bifunctional pyr operon transcriptional regulator/uracil phosphoribosyltransferase, partial [Gammaproteobacteria bacterium]|nr:bifunctional pyr operon transcriptional regulator/uracil phosphoribosyltransferase [Gammaproteobacteria bacterium]